MGRWAPREVVTNALNGDRAAVEELIEAVWPGCYRLAVSAIGDRALGQDAAQEACVVVHRNVHSLRSVDAFDAWLYRIVMREAQRVRRRQRVSYELADEAMPASDDPARIDVWRSLAALTPDLRDVVMLFYVDDLRSEEIATILGVRHGTVRTRLMRARQALRGLLDDYDDSKPAFGELKHHAI